MGLFGKKRCNLCGEKIGLFGSRKLEDGCICTDCAGKLSPWFDERRHSTLAEIREQLAYREENKQAVRNFRATKELGEDYIVLFDDQAGKFMVSHYRDPNMRRTENPDVFDFSQVKDVSLDISDTRTELYTTDKNGDRVSFDPPRYRYRYRFYIKITLDHPYADEIQFQLNEYPVEIERADRSFSLFGDNFTPTQDYDYNSYKHMGEEIVRRLRQGKNRPERVPEENPPKAPGANRETMYCPFCGSKIRRGRFCENCGASLE